ncbi:MAG: endonuclease/exonuclease/phosphatase family protein [Chloroflexota bacterium]|jgi:endonuclease/exonuclease/phosphatase family metal-dependent hydrolase
MPESPAECYTEAKPGDKDPIIQVKRIAVSRPPEASPHRAIRGLRQKLAGGPPGRWLLQQLKRLIHTPLLSSSYRRVLDTFSAPDHLSFQAQPARQSRGPSGNGAPLTVMTANLWHDWPRHRNHRSRLEAFAQLVEEQGADVLLLQEVAHVGDFRADQWLATRLGMAFVYGQANGDNQSNSFEEGVAVLSRFPLAEPAICYLAPRPFSLVRRLAVGVTVKAPHAEFLAISAHLGHGRRLNTRQLNRLQEWTEKTAAGRPAIVGGDFNTGEDSPQMQRIRQDWLDLYRQANPDEDGTTYQLRWPWGNALLRQRLDYIFLQHGQPGHSPWRVIEATATRSPGLAHSDHLAVVARLKPYTDRNARPAADGHDKHLHSTDGLVLTTQKCI